MTPISQIKKGALRRTPTMADLVTRKSRYPGLSPSVKSVSSVAPIPASPGWVSAIVGYFRLLLFKKYFGGRLSDIRSAFDLAGVPDCTALYRNVPPNLKIFCKPDGLRFPKFLLAKLAIHGQTLSL